MLQPGSKLAIGSDHAGFAMKEDLKKMLADLGYIVDDKGTFDTASCDYPDFAAAVARDVAAGKAAAGVIVCSTGIGVSMTANKVRGVRAALVHHAYEAEMTRRHNDANVLCLGANITGPAIAREAVKTFLNTDFEGGRHQRRIDKMMAVENS
ncbi:MAG: ribose 5-phosphate isomerase B [Proteobacteria bacterium]|nr:ribose 5-phosphate isomerase B [Pseudomonadota bacterium]MBQ4360297.1 ribose 5-phosphate isomerase B [Pseudomonadota bacterium]